MRENDQPLLTWWRPNSAGYTLNIDNAGKYTNSEIEGSQGYYNNGYDTLAIPVEVVNELTMRAVSWDAIYELVGYDGKVSDLRPNSCGEEYD